MIVQVTAFIRIFIITFHLVTKPEGKRPLGRSRRRWDNNFKADIQEVGVGVWTGLNWLWMEKGGGHL
jgi:hypothetical protein